MSDNVHWLLGLKINEGALDDFKALMSEMVAATKSNEPNAMNYEWFISEDNATAHVYERYADSAAVMTHLQWFGENAAERFLAAVEPTSFLVFGDPSADVREALAGFGAVHYGQIGGFARTD